MERGLRLAVVMLNEAGGIGGRPVQLLLRDDGSDPEAAAAIYRELAATDSIDLLVGPYASSITAAVVPVAEAAARPLVTPLAGSHTIWSGRNREWSVQMLNDARDNLSGAVIVGARAGVENRGHGLRGLEISRFGGGRGPRCRGRARPPPGHGREVRDRRGRSSRALGPGTGSRGGPLPGRRLYRGRPFAFTRAVAGGRLPSSPLELERRDRCPGFPAQVGPDLARCMIGNAPWGPVARPHRGSLRANATFLERYEEAPRRPSGLQCRSRIRGHRTACRGGRGLVVAPTGRFPRPACATTSLRFDRDGARALRGSCRLASRTREASAGSPPPAPVAGRWGGRARAAHPLPGRGGGGRATMHESSFRGRGPLDDAADPRARTPSRRAVITWRLPVEWTS